MRCECFRMPGATDVTFLSSILTALIPPYVREATSVALLEPTKNVASGDIC